MLRDFRELSEALCRGVRPARQGPLPARRRCETTDRRASEGETAIRTMTCKERTMPRLILLVIGALFMCRSVGRAGEPALKYPDTKRIDHADMLHGLTIVDPYRWLEQDVRVSKEVAD